MISAMKACLLFVGLHLVVADGSSYDGSSYSSYTPTSAPAVSSAPVVATVEISATVSGVTATDLNKKEVQGYFVTGLENTLGNDVVKGKTKFVKHSAARRRLQAARTIDFTAGAASAAAANSMQARARQSTFANQFQTAAQSAATAAGNTALNNLVVTGVKANVVSSKKKLGDGAIAGIVIGSVILAAALLAAIYYQTKNADPNANQIQINFPAVAAATVFIFLVVFFGVWAGLETYN